MDLVGKVLGKYKIVEKLGSGGMADVYKGLQVGLEREVAIKVLPPEHATSADHLKRFKRESQSTAKLSHPNIITIYDSGEQDGCHYYVMEYLKAESLATIIKKEGTLPLRRAIKIGKDILKALIYTHDKSIIHRDLKPDNIKFDIRGNAIVTDFGLLKDLQQTNITMTGVSIGTPDYMSPEQLLGEEVNEQSDLYQLSLILYNMLTGTTPFNGKNPYSPGDSTTASFKPPSHFNNEVPEALDELIVKGLQRDKNQRFKSADEIFQALTKIERKIEARQLSSRAPTGALSGLTTKSVSTSKTISASSSSIDASTTAHGSLHYIASLLAGPSYQEQTTAELLYNVSMVVVPALLTIALLVLYFNGGILSRPHLKLLEQAIEEESKRAVISWKANAPCYSFIQYYTSLDSRQETPRSPHLQIEFREELTNLEPDTTYYFQFVFTYYPDDPDTYSYSKELEFKTKPEIKIRNIAIDQTDREVRITWSTNLETDTKVRLGRSTDYVRDQENREQMRETDHSITISGLEPDTQYHFSIVATDPDQPGEPTFSKDQTFVTRKPGQNRTLFDDPQSNEPPLVELARSYVDKLTRMTPDERRKLKDSLQNYLIIDADKMLTAAKKKEIIRNSSTEENFNDRLRFFKAWLEQLKKSKIEHGYRDDEDAVIQSLFFVNKHKAFEKLDKYIKNLSTIDPEIRGG